MKKLKPLKKQKFYNNITNYIIMYNINFDIIQVRLIFKNLTKRNFEKQVLNLQNKTKKTIFSINQITLFSSCDAQNKIGNKSNFTIENLYAYTDIAIFINKNAEENNLENTLKKCNNKKYFYRYTTTARTSKFIL